MFKIIGKTIKLTRGDTAFLQIEVTNGGEVYVLQDGDEVIFTVKDSTSKTDSLIKKVLTNQDYNDGRLVFKINGIDTKPLRYKEYVYDVQVSLNHGEIVNTIIPPNTFEVLEEVSF